MRIVKYVARKHFPILEAWLTKRNVYLPNIDEMPKIGYVAFKRDLPVAIGFLRLVEGGFGMLDGLATNPAATSKQRHVGIEAVVTTILIAGRGLQLKHILAHTADKSTLLRARAHGFAEVPQTLIAVDLTDKLSLC